MNIKKFTAGSQRILIIFLRQLLELTDPVTGQIYLGFISKTKIESIICFIQDEWQLANDWELTVGLRFDNYTQFGESDKSTFGFVWSTAYNLTMTKPYMAVLFEPLHLPNYSQK